MVSNNGQMYIPPTSREPDISAILTDVADSFSGDTFVSYVDVAARNAAMANINLTDAQKKGILCHVQTGASRGVWLLDADGTTWRRVSLQGISYQVDVDQGNCDGNGIRSVNHGLPAAPRVVQVTMEGDASQIKYLKPAVVLIDSTKFLVKFWYSDPAGNSSPIVNSNAYASFHWAAFL